MGGPCLEWRGALDWRPNGRGLPCPEQTVVSKQVGQRNAAQTAGRVREKSASIEQSATGMGQNWFTHDGPFCRADLFGSNGSVDIQKLVSVVQRATKHGRTLFVDKTSRGGQFVVF